MSTSMPWLRCSSPCVSNMFNSVNAKKKAKAQELQMRTTWLNFAKTLPSPSLPIEKRDTPLAMLNSPGDQLRRTLISAKSPETWPIF